MKRTQVRIYDEDLVKKVDDYVYEMKKENKDYSLNDLINEALAEKIKKQA